MEDLKQKAEAYKKLCKRQHELAILCTTKPSIINRWLFKRVKNKLAKIDRSIGRYHRPFGNYTQNYDFSKIKA